MKKTLKTELKYDSSSMMGKDVNNCDVSAEKLKFKGTYYFIRSFVDSLLLIFERKK